MAQNWPPVSNLRKCMQNYFDFAINTRCQNVTYPIESPGARKTSFHLHILNMDPSNGPSPAKKAKTETNGVFSRHSVCLVLDYGSQYTQLIARRVRENGVLSVLLPGDVTMVRFFNTWCSYIQLSSIVYPVILYLVSNTCTQQRL